MFGPIGGGLTNGQGSPISSGATQGPTQSGSSGGVGDVRLGNVNLGGLSGTNITLIVTALVAGYWMMN
ncbi:hypothetical protein [Vibrio rotiferianus]|uniref:hypothetical protein n=1 Tax=Vibrio rotiferianus TaxID=190895 RepID=UPI0005EFFA85|nr:hypothetical protein [Vibrio rotiferianus]